MGQSLTEGQRDLIQCDRKKRRLDKWSEEQGILSISCFILRLLLWEGRQASLRERVTLPSFQLIRLIGISQTSTRSFPDRMRSQNKLSQVRDKPNSRRKGLGKAICPSISLKAIDPLLKGTLFPIAIVQNSTPAYLSLSDLTPQVRYLNHSILISLSPPVFPRWDKRALRSGGSLFVDSFPVLSLIS